MLLYIINIIELAFSMGNSESDDCPFKSKAIWKCKVLVSPLIPSICRIT